MKATRSIFEHIYTKRPARFLEASHRQPSRCVFPKMKISLTEAGSLALAYKFALAGKAPISGSQIIEANRDWKVLHAAVERQTKGGHQKYASYSPYNLDYSNYWYANVTAGGLNVQMLLDTGSADLWLVDPSASSDATGGVGTWDPTQASDTTLMSGYSFDVSYGEGGNGVSGPVYESEVCMGSACTNMAVDSAQKDQGLGTFPKSGIMGFAFQGGNSVSPGKQPTFMELLAPSLNEPIFVTQFTAEGSGSQISLGAINFDYVPPLQEITVDSSATATYPYSWSYNEVRYFRNGKVLGTFDVVFDTGGPMTSASEDIIRGYYDGIPGVLDVNGDASSWTVPCGTPLPNLEMQLGNATAVIPGHRFYNGNTATTGNCTVWFVKENSPTRGVIGDPFFCQHVVVFNQDATTIQWGNQVS